MWMIWKPDAKKLQKEKRGEFVEAFGPAGALASVAHRLLAARVWVLGLRPMGRRARLRVCLVEPLAWDPFGVLDARVGLALRRDGYGNCARGDLGGIDSGWVERTNTGDPGPWLIESALGLVHAGSLDGARYRGPDSFQICDETMALTRLFWVRLTVLLLGVAVVLYMVAIPMASMMLERAKPKPSISRIETDLTPAELLRVKSAEAVTAFWFFALGASLGSFLNVIAYRWPRGRSIVLQRSRCPECGTAIRGKDNVPILGWLLLGGLPVFDGTDCQQDIEINFAFTFTLLVAYRIRTGLFPRPFLCFYRKIR